MSSVVIKSEEIIVDTNEYNSDDVDEELNLTFEDTGGEIYHRYPKSHHQDSSHVSVMSSQQHHRNEGNAGSGSDQPGGGNKNPANKNILESEKRIRREIANSNERRRMQSINAGFQNLRALLPRHEGEKLSKAAILQQTSQYICDLENQKTQLLAQNSQLKRTLGQHELALSGYGSGGAGNIDDGSSAIKKRKLTDNVISLQTISDSSDEGVGSVSPEPTTLLQGSGNTTGAVSLGMAKAAHGNAYITHSAKELLEMKKTLEKERRLRAVAEEELRQMKRRMYTDNFITREVIEHTDNVRDDDGQISYVTVSEKHEPTEVIVCTSMEDINDECAEIISDDNIHEEIIMAQETEVKYADSTALQPILQAAIKAQPKVEVERINETVMKISPEKDNLSSQKKSSAAAAAAAAAANSIGLTRSRQNLETIVEAIRHLEGDHLFGDSAVQQKKAQKSQESPLALTTKQLVSTNVQPLQQHHQQQQQRKTIAELSPFLQIKNPKLGTNIVTIVRGGRSISLAPSADNSLSIASVTNPSNHGSSTATLGGSNNPNASNSPSSILPTNSGAVPTALVKVQTPLSSAVPVTGSPSHITITQASLKQCRPGVIVAKQIS